MQVLDSSRLLGMAYMRKAITFFSLAGTVLSLAACGAQLDTMASAGTRGDSRILLTDAPFPYYRVSRADIYVVSVSLSTSTDTSAGAVGGAFTTVATPNKRINMLALQNGLTELLGTARLPVGSITAVRMVIGTRPMVRAQARSVGLFVRARHRALPSPTRRSGSTSAHSVHRKTRGRIFRRRRRTRMARSGFRM